MAMISKKYFVFVVFLTLFGCQAGDLHFKIRFDDIMGLKSGDSIFFEGNSIGKVDNVVYTKEGDYLVEVMIQPNFANAATRDSQFYITTDPQIEGRKAIEIIQKKAGGEVLENGETVAGLVKSTIFKEVLDHLQKEARRYQGQLDDDFERLKESLRHNFQRLEDGLEETLDDLSAQFKRLSEEFQQVPDSQELKALEEGLDRLAEEMARSQEAIREKMKTEVIPEIQKRLNLMRESLERYNRQDEIDRLDRQLNEMREI
jgi:paraquat-inducible protein B